MWNTSEIAKVLDGYMWPPKTEVVNQSEDNNISVHVDTKPRKCGCLLSKGAKQKKISTNRVFNNSSETLWTKKVRNNSLNNQPSLLVEYNGSK